MTDKIKKIEYLDKKEISVLIQDIKDILNDNIPIITIDTYDIVSYCFPFTIDGNKNVDEISFDHKGYSHVFNKYRYNPIVLDEYLDEIISIYLRTNKFKQSVVKKDFVDKLKNDFKKAKDKKSFFDSNLTKILAYVNGVFHNNRDKFIHYLNHRIQITKFKLFNNDVVNEEDEHDESELYNIIKNTRPNKETVKKVFEIYKNNFSNKIKALEDKELKKDFDKSTYIDIQVMVRLHEINEKINESYKNNFLYKNYKFLYLSSTPKKSKYLQAELIKVLKLSEESYLLRNIYHISWVLIFKDYIATHENDRNALLDLIEKKLYNEIDIIKIINTKIKEESIELEKSKSFIKDNNKNFGNAIIFNNLKNDIESFKEQINNNENNLKEILDSLIDEINAYNKSSKYKELLKEDDLDEALKLKILNLEFYRDVFDKSLTTKIGIPFAKDIVKSRLQRLPLLFFHKIFDYNLEIKENFSKQFFELIKNQSYLFDFTEIKSFFQSFYNLEYRLFVTFLSVIYIDRYSNPEEIKKTLITNLEYLLELSKYRSADIVFTKKNKVDVKYKVDKNLYTEILYLLIWLKRQQNEESYYFSAKEDLKNYKNLIKNEVLEQDPRVLQSEGLLYISWARLSNLNKLKKVKLLKKGLNKIINSYNLYILEDNNYVGNYNELYKLTLIATLNTIVDTKNKIAVLSKKYDEFNRENKQDFAPRVIFDLLKEKIFSLSEPEFDYLKLPSINHTEIELECNEIEFYTKNEISIARKIVNHTEELIHQIKSAKNIPNEINKYFENSFNRFNMVKKVLNDLKK